MKAVILAAGVGNRLGTIKEKRIPKCLLEIGGQTLLERQLETLNECGIKSEDILIVIGGKGEVWEDKNKEKVKEIHNAVIVNDENLEKNQSHSLMLALEKINDGFICLDGDLLFSKEIVKKMIIQDDVSVLLTRKTDLSGWGNRVLITGSRVKELTPQTNSDVVYIGVAKFNKELSDALRVELKSGEHSNSSMASPINNLCKNHSIHILDTDEIININTEKDYQEAKDLITNNVKNSNNWN